MSHLLIGADANGTPDFHQRPVRHGGSFEHTPKSPHSPCASPMFVSKFDMRCGTSLTFDKHPRDERCPPLPPRPPRPPPPPIPAVVDLTRCLLAMDDSLAEIFDAASAPGQSEDGGDAEPQVEKRTSSPKEILRFEFMKIITIKRHVAAASGRDFQESPAGR